MDCGLCRYEPTTLDEMLELLYTAKSFIHVKLKDVNYECSTYIVVYDLSHITRATNFLLVGV